MSEPNGVMMQYFHWYTTPDGNLWNELQGRAKELVDYGVNSATLSIASRLCPDKSI